MTLNRTTRRPVAVPPRLRTIAALCLGLLLAGVATATAQHPGGMMQGPRGMWQYSGGMSQGDQGSGGGMRGPGGMMGGRHDGMRERAFGSSLVSPIQVPRTGLQLGLGGRWWDDHKTVKKLNLRSDQLQRMDSIFEANKPTLVTLLSNLQREEIHLAALPPGDLQDETKVFAAIDRVTQARTDLEKEKVHMLLQIRNQLDAQQLVALDREIASVH